MSSRASSVSSAVSTVRAAARHSLIVVILVLMVTSSLSAVVSAQASAAPAPRPYSGPAATYESVTFTGNPASDFPSDALLYTNLFTPWGSSNNLSTLYGTWNATQLFLGISGVAIGSGNRLFFAVSNDSAYGTTNLSNLSGVAGAGYWDRPFDFTQPMNYLFIVNNTGMLTSYEVTSQPGAAITTVATLTPAAVDNTISATGTGNLEIALSFASMFPVFPTGAAVRLYAAIAGGGASAGPTIPSGQTFDDTYSSSNPEYQLTSHDIDDGTYLLENTYYTLYLDPLGLGHPETGIVPNYIENRTFHTVAFTGAVTNDFTPGEQADNNTNFGWSNGITSYNNRLNSSYITWNETTLFLGFNDSVSGTNSLGIFISNDSKSGVGTYSLNTTNIASINRPFAFSQPVNFIATVNYSGIVPGPLSLFEVTSAASSSNTSSTVVNVTSLLPETATSTSSVELAIPFNVLYDRPGSWPIIGQFANFSVVAAIHSSSGNYTGPTLPSGQTSTNGYNTFHRLGADTLFNTFFTQNLDPYGDGMPAPQVNPTYTYGHSFHTVTFTGQVTRDFDPLEIVGTNTSTPWGMYNQINATYATWNYTAMFFGTNSTVQSAAEGSQNYMLVAISNDTGVGATNFSATNVANLTRNFTFSTPVNFVFSYSGGAPNGTLYEVDMAATNASFTTFTDLGSWPVSHVGAEFAIPFSVMYPGYASCDTSTCYGAQPPAFPPGVSPQLVAFIYGGTTGKGAYIGPTIPAGQSFSSATAAAPIKSYVGITIDPNKDGYAEPGITPAAPPVVYAGNPIGLNILFNDHQPLYAPIGGSYTLPWTVVHLEEYLEQALIAGLYPDVNITYSLSGSLLYQIDAIAHGDYNNSYLEAASIPTSQWGNSIYTEVTTYGDSFLSTFVQPYQWNSTTVAYVLENNLAFNSPPWVYYEPNNASKLYLSLYDMWTSGQSFTTAQLEEAVTEFFLWSTSFPVATGQLGAAYRNSTMAAFYNDTSFTIGDISTIQAYYPYEAQMVLSAFSHDRMLNDGAGGNVELITTPFDHPILPLLELNNWTDENGVAISKGVWTNDSLAQLQIGAGIYKQMFGQDPLGLWSPEQAVSASEIPLVNETGYEWTASSQATLQEAGLVASDSSPSGASQMEALYTPYLVKNGTNSTVMVFRDDGLSNDWGFNYGTVANQSGSEAAVSEFVGYLKNVYALVPRADHSSILVTVALDGENWMFMGSTGHTFPEDGVPFLEDLYAALAGNSSWLQTITPQQYLVTHPASTLPTITSLPTGSWNNEPSGTGINSYLGQWAGNPLQDSTWQQLALVRSEVQAYGTANDLTQPMNLTTLEEYNDFPYLTQWNTTSLEGKYVEAWTAIYGAEGSDLYFSFSPDQSATAQNAIVFEQEVRSDLSLALTVLGLPLTPFLKAQYMSPETPTTWGTNASISPVLSGSLYTTETFPGGIGYSVNHNLGWSGSYVEATGATTPGAGTILKTTYAFDVSNLYFSIEVNGSTSAYKSPTFYTPATDALEIFFSSVNPGQGNLLGLNVLDSVYTVGGVPFGFAATTEATIEGNTITPTGSATLGLFTGAAGGTWVASSTLPIPGDGWVGGQLQVQVPMSAIGSGMQPGDSVEFFVAAVNGTTGVVQSYSGPLLLSVPASLAKLTVISTIHNTAAGNGPGTSEYPTQLQANKTPDFPPNAMTIEWLQVAMNPYTVQFNVTFGNLSNVFGGAYGFSQPVIDIYIHTAGSTGGLTTGLPGSNVNISSADNWQYAIQATGYSSGTFNAIVTSSGQQYPADVVISSNTGYGSSTNAVPVANATVSIRVPTAVIGTAITTDTFVIVAGSQDGDSVGGTGDDWRPFVNGPAAAYNGGTTTTLSAAEFANYPNVYSYIAPAVVGQGSGTQQSLLSTYSATSMATLEGITLPSTVKVVYVPTLGASTIVNASGDPEAFYAFGTQVYSSTSTDGINWTTPTPLVNLSFIPSGLAAVGGTNPGLLAWSNTTSLVFENLVTHAFSNSTAPGTIEAGSVTYANGGFLLAIDVGGTVYLIAPGSSTPKGSAALSATTVGLSTTTDGLAYLAYTNATGLAVVMLNLSSSTAPFGTKLNLTGTLPTGSTAESLAFAAAPNGGFAIAVALKNASGSNIYLAIGAGAVSLKAVTNDGADSSPSVLLEESAGTWKAYVGFTNSASGGNVYFLPNSVGTVSAVSSAPPPPPTTTKSSSSSTPLWEWIVIGVVIVVVIVGILAALLMRRKKGGAPPTEPPTTTAGEAKPSTEPPAGDTSSAPGGGTPPSG